MTWTQAQEALLGEPANQSDFLISSILPFGAEGRGNGVLALSITVPEGSKTRTPQRQVPHVQTGLPTVEGEEVKWIRALQHRSLWHIDYFELKATGKQQIREGPSDHLLSIQEQAIHLHEKDALPVPGRENILVTGDEESTQR